MTCYLRFKMEAIKKPELVRAKPIATKTMSVATRRPAFDEIGNKFPSAQPHHVLKKPGLPTVPQRAVLKAVENFKPVSPRSKKPLKHEESNLIHRAKEASYSSKQLTGIIDVDESQDNPLLVAEYIKDIINYLLELEVKFAIHEGYLVPDHKSNPRMRSILVNWMSDVCDNFRFLAETFHLSVAIVDRYLQNNKGIGQESLQLVGATAILVASKYEENYSAHLEDFVYICADTYTKQQILSMECDILKRLGFSFGRPLSLDFLRRFNRIANDGPKHHMLGRYLLELALLEYSMCHIKPSLQAAAACCLAISILDDVNNPVQIWTESLVHYSTYSFRDIKATITKFATTLLGMEKSNYQAIKKHFASSSKGKISLEPKLNGPLVCKLAVQAKLYKK